MRIIIDVMSGDNAPLELVRGAAKAASELDVDIAVVGKEDEIRSISEENGLDISGIDIINADDVITMEDSALSVMKEKSGSSMSIGLKTLASGEGDAFVSAGNTGALVAGATLIVRKVKGVRRAAIATILPFDKPMLLIDSGANLEVSGADAKQFAFMGSVYCERMLGIKQPRVGNLNNGVEETKGTEDARERYFALKDYEKINFVGNIESRELPFDACDVLVADGFSGNIVLKLAEGMGKYMLKKVKSVVSANIITKLSALGLKNQLMEVKRQLSASEYGGAPLLGISKPVIKAHGSSNADDIVSAIKQASVIVSSGVIGEIARTVRKEAEERAEAEARAKAEAEAEATETSDNSENN